MSNALIQHTAVVSEELTGQRLDKALAMLLPDYSRSRLTQWIRDGQVTLDQSVCHTPREKVTTGQQITLAAEIIEETRWEAQAIALDIVYEDSAIIVLNKPAKLVVHPGNGNPDSTLVNALLHHAPELSKVPRAGIVHRIDKDTTGLLVIAKTLPAHTSLVNQIQARQVKREYEAVVHGHFIAGGTVDAPIGRHPHHRTRMAVTASGKPAVTHYRIQQKFAHHSLLRLTLDTGRTHQIRVHMRHIQHPIVGDQTYTNRINLPTTAPQALADFLATFKRQALHARQLTFQHPVSQEEVSYSAPRPADFQGLIDLLSLA